MVGKIQCGQSEKRITDMIKLSLDEDKRDRKEMAMKINTQLYHAVSWQLTILLVGEIRLPRMSLAATIQTMA